MKPEIIELYAHDYVHLESQSLWIDKDNINTIISLISKFILIISRHFCELEITESNLSIVHVEKTLFYQKDLLIHLINISSVLSDDYIQRLITKTQTNGKTAMKTVVLDLLHVFVTALDPNLYQALHSRSIDRSIDYVLKIVMDTDKEEIFNAISNVIKIKSLTFKH